MTRPAAESLRLETCPCPSCGAPPPDRERFGDRVRPCGQVVSLDFLLERSAAALPAGGGFLRRLPRNWETGRYASPELWRIARQTYWSEP
jgi:hypothetical protein